MLETRIPVKRAASRFVNGILVDRPWIGVALVSLFYWGLTLYVATKRLFWIDEFATLYYVQLKTFGDVWKFMMTGADQTPPYYMLVTHAFVALFGPGELWMRIPPMAGFWIAMLCLYRITARLSSPLFGLIAMTVPTAFPISAYATEARSYGLLLGFSALALMFWIDIERSDPKFAAFSRCALAGSLCLATCCHYYGVLVPIPLALGEMVRTVQSRKFDMRTWVAFAAVLIPLPAAYPAIVAARSGLPQFWFKPQFHMGFTWFDSMLSGPPLLALLLALAIYNLRGSSWPPPPFSPPAPSKSSVAALLGLLGFPFVAILFAIFLTGAYGHRYVIATVLGVSVLFTLAAHRLTKGDMLAGICILGVLFVSAGDLSKRRLDDSKSSRQALMDYAKMADATELEGAPILFGNIQEWMRTKRYLNGSAQTRALFPIDTDRSTTQEQSKVLLFTTLRPVAPPGIIGFASCKSTWRKLGVYAPPGNEDSKWLIPALIQDGWSLRAIAQIDYATMYLAERK